MDIFSSSVASLRDETDGQATSPFLFSPNSHVVLCSPSGCLCIFLGPILLCPKVDVSRGDGNGALRDSLIL